MAVAWARDRLAGQADHALHEILDVVAARQRLARRTRRCRRGGRRGGRRELVDEHPVADLERRDHRLGRDVERLEQEGLDQERDDQRRRRSGPATRRRPGTSTCRLVRPLPAFRTAPSSPVSGSASAVGAAPLPDPPTLESSSVTGSTPVAAGAADATTSVGIGIGLRAGRVGSTVDGHGRAPRRPSSRRRWTSHSVAGQDPRGRGPRRLGGVVGPDHGRQRAELQQEALEQGRLADREHDLVAAVAELGRRSPGEALDDPRRLGREARVTRGSTGRGGRRGRRGRRAIAIGQWPRLEGLAGRRATARTRSTRNSRSASARWHHAATYHAPNAWKTRSGSTTGSSLVARERVVVDLDALVRVGRRLQDRQVVGTRRRRRRPPRTPTRGLELSSAVASGPRSSEPGTASSARPAARSARPSAGRQAQRSVEVLGEPDGDRAVVAHPDVDESAGRVRREPAHRQRARGRARARAR